MTEASNSSVTLASLELLKRTAEYLARLPVVPSTRALLREIQAHLNDPDAAAVEQEAQAARVLASKRTAQLLSPAGRVRFEVVVDAETVFFRAPRNPILSEIDTETVAQLSQLESGVTLRLHPAD
jgi:hypothetical protein